MTMRQPFPHRRLLPLLLLLASSTAVAASKGDLSLRADPAYVSPNNDGLQDQAFFYPVIQSADGVTRWRLDIHREGKGRQTRLTGAGMPALIMWDVLDKKGAISADGAYRARFEVWGKVGHLSADAPFWIDTKPPKVGLSVSTSTLEATNLATSSATFRPEAVGAAPIARWQLQILDDVGRTVFLTWSTGPVHEVAWNGSDRQTRQFVAKGRYHAAFQAWDAAGNGSDAAFVDVAVTATGDRVEGGLGGIAVHDIAHGQYVQLESDNLFAYVRGHIVLSDAADAILTDLAAWINTYPEAAIVLEGHSNAYHALRKDRELASRYAWLVYSHLVKKGQVTASRIQVQGRGAEDVPHSHEGDVKSASNGVDVLLLKKSE